MGIATDRYFTIVTHSESFGKQASQLGHLLNGLETQRNQIEASLKLLAGLLETAASGLPQLEAKIIELTQQVTYGVRQNQDEMTKVIHESSVNLQTTITDLKKLILETTQTTNQEVNAHFTQLSEKTNEQIIKLDQAMERELNNALKSLGTQLASLSKKFVDDYAPLTDKLRDLVKIAGRA
jgi:DNA anti-recombination protein RmuC